MIRKIFVISVAKDVRMTPVRSSINGDRLIVTKGKVHAVFLDEAREICRDFQITSGWIGGVKRGKATALRFSNSIPRPCQQRLRNAWFCP